MSKIKNFILRKLGILSLRKKVLSLEKENKKMKEQIASLTKTNNDLKTRLSKAEKANNSFKADLKNLEKFIFSQNRGLAKPERDRRIIVSMTSYPARITAVPIVLERMLVQTVRPDKIILWLAKEQFPNREADLPEELIALKADGVEIKWCDGDMKAYKKVLPALKEYPDDLVVIIDDDLMYRVDLIESLYNAHLKHPEAIIAARVHQIQFDEEGQIAPYLTWKKECNFAIGEIHRDWFFTGGAGTLIPPHTFGTDIFDTDTIMELCPHADDMWLNIHCAIRHVPILNVANNYTLTCLEGTQTNRLYDINKGQNDVQLQKLRVHYREQLAGTLYES